MMDAKVLESPAHLSYLFRDVHSMAGAPMTPLIAPFHTYTRFARNLSGGTMLLAVDVRSCERVINEDFTWRVWAVTSLQAPDQYGLPMDAENEMLAQALEELTVAIPNDGTVVYLGTMVHDGTLVACFHSAMPGLFGNAPSSRINGSRYEWFVYTEEDRSSEFVRLKLLPTPQEKRRIQDREVLDALAEAGDNNVVPRPITFYGLFRAEDEALSAARMLDAQGYRTTPPSKMPGKGEFNWSLSFTRTASTEYHTIDHVSATAHEICVNYGGHYDSWSCEPVVG